MSEGMGDAAIMYVGTYTRTEPHVQGRAEGIYVYRLHHDSGELHHLSTAPGVMNPSFLVVDSGRRYLYAVEEIGEYEGRPGGAVTAFAVDPGTHALTRINSQATHGGAPCYVSIDASGHWLLAANYGGGNVSVLPIAEDGSLGPATSVVQHHGPSLHHDGPHPHSIVPDPAGRYVLVPDCGLDRVYVYRLDTTRGALVEHDVPWAELLPASGPRHLAFHPDGAYLYCINERGSSVTALAYDAERGILREIQTLSTLPQGFTGKNACADIHLDPSGRYLYGSNRGHNSIAIFAVEAETGEMRPVGHVPTGGRTPRNFAVDPTGRYLFAANQDTDTVVTFAIDPVTGTLTPAGPVASIPTPVCLHIVEPSRLPGWL